MAAPATLRREARVRAEYARLSGLRKRSTFQVPKHNAALAQVRADMRLAMILQALDRAKSIAEAARNLGMDRGAMMRDFHALTGVRIGAWMRHVGLEGK